MNTSIVASHELPVNVRWALATDAADAEREAAANFERIRWTVRDDYDADLSDEYDLGPDCDYGADRWAF